MGIKKPFTAPIGVDLDNNKIVNVATPTESGDGTNRTFTVNASNISTGTLGVAYGGTGATTSTTAINNLLPGQATATGTVLTSNGSNISWGTVGLSGQVYVTANGNNSIADGSISKPFGTITAALNYLNANYPVTNNSGVRFAVVIGPGNYTENISLTRPLTTLVGLEGKLKTTFITGTITVNPGSDYSGIFQNTFALYNLFINGNNADALVLAGTIQCSLDVFNCYLYSSGADGFLVTSTASGGNRIRLMYTDVITAGNANAIDISNTTNCVISDSTISSASTAEVVKLTGSTLTIANCQMSSSTAANIINLVSGTLNLGYTAVSSSATNGSGLNIASGATAVVTNSVYNVAVGSGAAVKGVSGSVYVNGLNSFVFGTNTTISSAITELLMTTKISAADIRGTATLTGLTVNGAASVSGNVTFTSTTASTSTTTGALIVSGGVGVANNLNANGNILVRGSGGLGYGTGSGGSVTQETSRTTGVIINKTNGSITLVSEAATTSWQSFVVTNNTVATSDTIIVNQKSGTDKYMIHVTNVSAGAFTITYATTGGTTTEQPVFNFSVIKAVTT